MSLLLPWLPVWVREYPKAHLGTDLMAGLIVGVLVIPQSLGYALLAGLPPVYGLYAAILPVLAYAWVGSSNTQAVGPVAVTSVMSAQALAGLSLSGTAYAAQAALLAGLVGFWLLLAALLRLGWITQFISRGVMSGLVSGAALLIALGQLRHVLGLNLHGDTLPALGASLWGSAQSWHPATALLGLSTLGLLWLARHRLTPVLLRLGLSLRLSQALTRLAPVLVLVLMTAVTGWLQLQQQGVAVVGAIAAGLPDLHWPDMALPQVLGLAPAAGLIALVAFVSSVSVAQDVAYRRQEPFEANRELRGLGLANLAAAVSQGFPVTGGFSRTAVNLEAGAQTPLAGVVSAAVMALILLGLTPWFFHLPLAALGAGIWMAVLRMVDVDTLRQAWASDRSEAVTLLVTVAAVLLAGLQYGLVVGLLWSFASLVQRSSQPHVAVVGPMPDDPGHFRNVSRHPVQRPAGLLLIRIDESIFFGNSRSLQRQIMSALDAAPDARHVVLMGQGINDVDLTGQLMLQTVNRLLQARGLLLHLSEIKGPVMDRLQHSVLLQELSGQVFWSTREAVARLTAQPEPDYFL